MALRDAMAAGNGQAVADADLGIGLDVVGVRQSHERNAVLARDADQAFARRDDVDAFGGAAAPTDRLRPRRRRVDAPAET